MADDKRFHVVTVQRFTDGPARIRSIEAYAVADRLQANGCVTKKTPDRAKAQREADSMNAWRIIEHYDGSTGEHVCSIPHPAIEACAHSGPCDDDVAHWLPLIVWHASDERLRRILKESGGWDDSELTDRWTNRERVLWLACWDIKENRDDDESTDDDETEA